MQVGYISTYLDVVFPVLEICIFVPALDTLWGVNIATCLIGSRNSRESRRHRGYNDENHFHLITTLFFYANSWSPYGDGFPLAVVYELYTCWRRTLLQWQPWVKYICVHQQLLLTIVFWELKEKKTLHPQRCKNFITEKTFPLPSM